MAQVSPSYQGAVNLSTHDRRNQETINKLQDPMAARP